MFSEACVKNSVHRGDVCPSACWDTHSLGRQPPTGQTTPQADTPRQTPPCTDTPLGKHPPGRHPPLGRHHPTGQTPQRPLQRTVRILLECILVVLCEQRMITVWIYLSVFNSTSSLTYSRRVLLVFSEYEYPIGVL